MKLLPRKPINADDNIGRGMDLALVTLVFLGIGYGLDRWLDTRPAFMIGMVIFALVGQFVRMWYGYDASMKDEEAVRVAEVRSQPRSGRVLPAEAPALKPSQMVPTQVKRDHR